MDALKYDLKQVIFICKRQVLLLFVCIIIEGCMTYAQPLLLTKITDQGILGKNLTALLSSVLFFVAAKVSVAGMGVLRSYEFVKIHNQMFGRLNEKAFAKLYRIPIREAARADLQEDCRKSFKNRRYTRLPMSFLWMMMWKFRWKVFTGYMHFFLF